MRDSRQSKSETYFLLSLRPDATVTPLSIYPWKVYAGVEADATRAGWPESLLVVPPPNERG